MVEKVLAKPAPQRGRPKRPPRDQRNCVSSPCGCRKSCSVVWTPTPPRCRPLNPTYA